MCRSRATGVRVGMGDVEDAEERVARARRLREQLDGLGQEPRNEGAGAAETRSPREFTNDAASRASGDPTTPDVPATPAEAD
jgi:hypothetical protein